MNEPSLMMSAMAMAGLLASGCAVEGFSPMKVGMNGGRLSASIPFDDVPDGRPTAMAEPPVRPNPLLAPGRYGDQFRP